MIVLRIALIVLAFGCFAVAALRLPTKHFDPVAAGLGFWILSEHVHGELTP